MIYGQVSNCGYLKVHLIFHLVLGTLSEYYSDDPTTRTRYSFFHGNQFWGSVVEIYPSLPFAFEHRPM